MHYEGATDLRIISAKATSDSQLLGPLETLFVYHGAAVIERVEVRAKIDKAFAWRGMTDVWGLPVRIPGESALCLLAFSSQLRVEEENGVMMCENASMLKR